MGVDRVQIGFVSLGCTKNQIDSELMQGLLTAGGHTLVANVDEAEVIIVNTCGFIQAAKEESIQAILAAAEHKKRRCRQLIVAGCLSQRYAKELLQDIPEVDGLVGTGSFTTIAEVVRRVQAGERVLSVGETDYDYEEDIERATSNEYSAYVKIAEGCSNWCSYCVIPLVRGGYRSRSMESILREVAKLESKGLRELNLIAQDTTRYGIDRYGEPRLAELLEKLHAIAGLQWIRLLYCYPDFFTDGLIEAMAALPKICKYVDMPLQHINDRILSAMHRRGTKQEIIALLHKLRARIPGLTIRTTFIVGFPSETEEEFRELRQFVAEMKFDHVGVFKYSREEDTAADALEGHVDESVKEGRYQELMLLQQEISRERNQRLVGTVQMVLVEGPWPEGKGVVGRAMKDAPEVDGVVYVRGAQASKGEFIAVQVQSTSEYDLFGVISHESRQ